MYNIKILCRNYGIMEHYTHRAGFHWIPAFCIKMQMSLIVADYLIFIQALSVYMINVFRLFVYKEKRWSVLNIHH